MIAELLLLIVLVVQVGYLLRSRSYLVTIRRITQREHAEYDQLMNGVTEDIRLRARHGQLSDWMACLDQFDRLFEPRLEKIRQIASSALATGVGGTMLIFAAELISVNDNDIANLREAGIALIGLASSIIGISVHLIIVLCTLKVAHDSVDEAAGKFKSEIRRLNKEAATAPSLGEGIRKELSDAFVEGMHRFPEVFRDVGVRLREIQKAVIARLAELNEVNQRLAQRFEEFISATKELTTTARQIQSTGERVEATAKALDALPKRMQLSLSEASVTWSTAVQSAHVDLVDAIQGTVTRQSDLVQEMRSGFTDQGSLIEGALDAQRTQQHQLLERLATLTSLLQNLPDLLGGAHTGLAEKFAHQSRNHVADLKRVIQSGMDELRKTTSATLIKLNQRFVSDSSRIVKEIFESLAAQISENLHEPLTSMGANLTRTTEALPGAASEFTTSLEEFSEALTQVPTKLESTAASIQQVTAGVDNLTDKLNDTLANSTQIAWEPASKEIAEFARQARSTHADLQRTIDHLISFIKELISRVNA